MILQILWGQQRQTPDFREYSEIIPVFHKISSQSGDISRFYSRRMNRGKILEPRAFPLYMAILFLD